MRRYVVAALAWGAILLGLFATYVGIFRVIHPFVHALAVRWLGHYLPLNKDAIVGLNIATLIGTYLAIVVLLALIILRTDAGAKAKSWFIAINREIIRHQ